MKSTTVKKVLLSVATACLVYQTSSCANNYRKYRASLTKPSEMIAVETDESDPQDITEIVHKVREAAKKDYKSVIKELKTPLDAKLYCTKILEYKDDSVVYGKTDYWASFKYIHKNKKDDCDGGALAAAAILSDDGFPPYIAVLSKKETPDQAHAIFVYKTTGGKYGSLGINILDCFSGFNSIEEIVKFLGYDSFQIYNISKRFPDYTDNDRNNDVRRNF
ncbi:MAG: hypothetical protein Q8O03_08795 [Nanoarchaeota archaeon]|nr:hypothetical protein [Nanoarchaeota archaeon]